MAKERAKKLAEKMVVLAQKKGGSKPTFKEAAIEVGYSKAYVKSNKIKKTEIWNELMEIHLPNSKLVQIHEDLLGSVEIQHYVFPRGKKNTQLNKEQIKAIIESVPGCHLIYIKNDHYAGQIAFFQSPDNKSRREALDLGYKLRGKYAPDQIQLVKRKYQDLSNAELAQLEKTLKDFLLKR